MGASMYKPPMLRRERAVTLSAQYRGSGAIARLFRVARLLAELGADPVNSRQREESISLLDSVGTTCPSLADPTRVAR